MLSSDWPSMSMRRHHMVVSVDGFRARFPFEVADGGNPAVANATVVIAGKKSERQNAAWPTEATSSFLAVRWPYRIDSGALLNRIHAVGSIATDPKRYSKLIFTT